MVNTKYRLITYDRFHNREVSLIKDILFNKMYKHTLEILLALISGDEHGLNMLE